MKKILNKDLTCGRPVFSIEYTKGRFVLLSEESKESWGDNTDHAIQKGEAKGAGTKDSL